MFIGAPGKRRQPEGGHEPLHTPQGAPAGVANTLWPSRTHALPHTHAAPHAHAHAHAHPHTPIMAPDAPHLAPARRATSGTGFESDSEMLISFIKKVRLAVEPGELRLKRDLEEITHALTHGWAHVNVHTLSGRAVDVVLLTERGVTAGLNIEVAKYYPHRPPRVTVNTLQFQGVDIHTRTPTPTFTHAHPQAHLPPHSQAAAAAEIPIAVRSLVGAAVLPGAAIASPTGSRTRSLSSLSTTSSIDAMAETSTLMTGAAVRLRDMTQTPAALNAATVLIQTTPVVEAESFHHLLAAAQLPDSMQYDAHASAAMDEDAPPITGPMSGPAAIVVPPAARTTLTPSGLTLRLSRSEDEAATTVQEAPQMPVTATPVIVPGATIEHPYLGSAWMPTNTLLQVLVWLRGAIDSAVFHAPTLQ